MVSVELIPAFSDIDSWCSMCGVKIASSGIRQSWAIAQTPS